MEVIVAVSIIATSLIACVVLMSSTIAGVSRDKSKVIAAHLAQEGIEIVRSIRDSNWIVGKRESDNWRDGLEEGNYRAQYNQLALMSFNNNPLKIDNNGSYQYDNGNDTHFKRKITIEHIDNKQIKAVSEVTWSEKGSDYKVEAELRLYNWLTGSD